MKLFKSLLLASATGLVAVSGASAADLGAKKPSPVEYVKACYNPLWGTSGGFVIPGTQNCLRIGGQARFDIGYGQAYKRNDAVLGYRGGGNIFLDSITPSEYGNVRAFINLSMIYRTGNQRSGTAARWGQSADSLTAAGFGSAGVTTLNGLSATGGAAGTDLSGSSGFIQFAGFTFGRTASFFGALGYAPSIISPMYGPGAGNVNQVAYTATLGNGFLATVAIEDPTTRRNGFFAPSTIAGIATNPANLLGNAPNQLLVAPTLNGASVQSSNRVPNVVAALRLDQAWGSAEISGLVSELRTAALTVPNAAGTAFDRYAGSKFGYSIAGGLKINLPMIAAGDALYLNAVYTDGVISSVTGNFFGGNLNTGLVALGGVSVGNFDAVLSPFNGTLRTTKAFAVNAGFQHFWTPTVSTTISGGYAVVNHGQLPTPGIGAGNVVAGFGDYKTWGVGVLNTWTPVRGLAIALDLAYVNIDPKGRVLDLNKTNTTNGSVVPAANQLTKSSDGQLIGRFRVTRDF